MYINTQYINTLEDMCLNKRTHYHGNRMLEREFDNFGIFGYGMGRFDEDSRDYQKYNLFQIKDNIALHICMGSEFLDMDLSVFDMKNRKAEYTDFLNSGEDKHFISRMFLGRRGQDRHLMENSLEFKMMNLEHTIQMSLYNIKEIFICQSMLNYTPLVNEWLNFANKNNIDIYAELKDIIDLIEKDYGSFKLYEELLEEARLIKRHNFRLLSKAHSKMSHNFGSDRFSRTEMFYSSNNRRQDIHHHEDDIDRELIHEINKSQTIVEEFNKKLQHLVKSINMDYFTDENIINNNKILLDSLFAAYQKLKHKIALPKTHATIFIKDIKKEVTEELNIETFISNQKNNIMIALDNVKLEDIRYQKVIVFTDSSCVVLKENETTFEFFIDIKKMKSLIAVTMTTYLKNTLRKNPTISKVMVQSFHNSIEKMNNKNEYRHHSPLQFNKILLSIDTYFKNENILKSLKYDFMEVCKTATSFEKVDDDMHKLIREHKIKKFAESIVSSKYKHLYTKESYKLFQELYDLNIDTKTLQEMLGKKMAAVETKQMFNENIKKLLNSLNEFDMDSVKLKANSYGAKIIADENEILILEIKDFVQSQKLGSASWCISRNQSYFEQYTEKGGKQYFIYDFNQDSKSVKSLVGITLTKAFKVKAAHSKSDSQFKDKKMIDYLIEKVKPIEVEKEKKPVATRKPRTKKVVTAPELTVHNIGF